ncbi:SRPBCC domain-containing protein [Actinocrinis sp.]|uniref:SRPBCC domain-containing protein n=1 Tax=Actinocrinis sp. TaxID=1920516 RepID=UPI002BECC5D0|nr:SRPBCC domain-containing protein [Actinocrinis sp.]HXR72774.1 SRPBCC domain-containing protein [Actinocrinis sp.]
MLNSDTEYGSIEREIHIDATPDVVYEVISTPEHLREWWPKDAQLTAKPGATGVIWFSDGKTADLHPVGLTVVEADPPRRFSFRWVYDEGATASPDNSLLVTFDLIPSGAAGTLLRFSETGYRERGWEVAVLEETYRNNVNGWDYFLPRLVTYVARLASTR